MKLKKLVNGIRISIWNVPNGKTGLPFHNFRLSREFSSGKNQKNVYHLPPNRIFRELVVNGKQPRRRDLTRACEISPDLITEICLRRNNLFRDHYTSDFNALSLILFVFAIVTTQ